MQQSAARAPSSWSPSLVCIGSGGGVWSGVGRVGTGVQLALLAVILITVPGMSETVSSDPWVWVLDGVGWRPSSSPPPPVCWCRSRVRVRLIRVQPLVTMTMCSTRCY